MPTPSAPLDEMLASWWAKLDANYKKALPLVLLVNLLAFGFEMTNLTIHHDDIWQIFLEDDILGHYLGRFALGWLHYYAQGAHIMPFLQVAEGIVVMTAYALVLTRLWGLRRTADIVLVASIVSVFPYVAQINQYNAVVVPYSIAHFLAAAAVMLSIRATTLSLTAAAVLYVGAFLIYQSVIANAAAIFTVWLLASVLFSTAPEKILLQQAAKSTIRAIAAVAAGGALYAAIVWLCGIQFDSYQRADEAFSLDASARIIRALPVVLAGTRSFFLWPEPYFPDILKKIQLVLLVAAAVMCVWLPRRTWKKVVAVTLLVITIFAPRLLQLLHPAGNFHNLTLTAYAVTIAGFLTIMLRGGSILTRNLSMLSAGVLIAGYLIQANWISTVNYLNTLAHYTTLTQILSRVRAIPTDHWDGKQVVVIGRYEMPKRYPFRSATGVATGYISEQHLQRLARLMRDELVVLPLEAVPKARGYASSHLPWPHPGSVGVVDGVGVVILSNEQFAKPAEGTHDPSQEVAPK